MDPRRAALRCRRPAIDPRRRSPAVDRVVARSTDCRTAARRLRADAVDAARDRRAAASGRRSTPSSPTRRRGSTRRRRALLRPVVNATGVLLHTNLGRAPLGADALATRPTSPARLLEPRVPAGRGRARARATTTPARCSRGRAAPRPGIVVNNNAAAVLLALAALARGRDGVVSRGELVEIGGGFRVPEIMAESGCRLVEVGTTNRTRLADYERALGADTALVLKVHASNYRMVGFTETTPVARARARSGRR